MIEYLSVCSGIEAATVAWHPLGWKPIGFAEIDAFPRAVLQFHYPHVPLHDDFTKLIAAPPAADLLVGGTPCQAFSVAGKRASLEDARGNLSLAFIELANAIDDLRRDRGQAPCVVVWENVPGVFSVSDNAFGCFIAGLVGEDTPIIPAGGRWTDAGLVVGPQRAAAWRTLDAQFFGLAQRRERVFVVASSRDGFDPAAILFEPEGVRRHSPPRREKGERPAGTLGGSSQSGGFRTTDLDNSGAFIPVVAGALAARGGWNGGASNDDVDARRLIGVPEVQAFGCNNTSGPIDVAGAILAHGGPHGRMNFDSETFIAQAFDIHGTPATAAASPTDIHVPLRARAPGQSEASTTTVVAQAFKASHFTRGKDGAPSEVAPPLSADADRGDQDTLVAVPIDEVVDPLTANSAKTYTHEGTGNFRLSNCVMQPVEREAFTLSGGSDRGLNVTPAEVATCLDTTGGNREFTEATQQATTLVVDEAQVYSIMPQNSGKDYKARPVDVAQPLMAGGPVGGNQGGDFIVQPLCFDETQITHPANRSNPQPGDPSPPLARGARPPTIAFAQNTRDEVRLQGGDGDLAGTLNADHGTHQTTYIAFSASDYGGDASDDLAPTLRAMPHDGSHATGGGQLAVAIPIAADADRASSEALTPSPDAEGRVRLRDPGLGVGQQGDPMFTLQATKPHAVAFAVRGREGGAVPEVHQDGDTVSALRAASGGSSRDMVGFQTRGGDLTIGDISGTMGTNADRASGGAPMIMQPTMQVRRLTPTECERLQGFPDYYTAIPWRGKNSTPDGPRYKALGNSMAVPVMRWIGRRIDQALKQGGKP